MIGAQNHRGSCPQRRPSLIHTTLLDLIQAVNRLTKDDRLVVAAVIDLLKTSRVRAGGSFAGAKVIVND